MIILVIQEKKREKGPKNVFGFHSHLKSKFSLGVTNLHEV